MTPELRQILRDIKTRVMMSLARGVVRAVNDAGGIQLVQVDLLDEELRGGVERVQNYGHTSVPLEGALAVAAFLGGNRDHGLAIAVDDRRHRVKGLQPGDSCLYTFQDADGGHRVLLTGDRQVVVLCKTAVVKADDKVTVDTPLTEMTGELRVRGDITDRFGNGGISVHAMREIYDRHVHLENDDGGPTDTPEERME